MDRPRSSHSCPHRTGEEIVEAIVQEKGKHLTWGPKKILARLASRYSSLPAVPTASDILKRNGLVKPVKKLRRKHPGCTRAVAQKTQRHMEPDAKRHILLPAYRVRYEDQVPLRDRRP